MRIHKIVGHMPKSNPSRAGGFRDFVALDWSETTMAIGHMDTAESMPRVWETRVFAVQLSFPCVFTCLEILRQISRTTRSGTPSRCNDCNRISQISLT